MNARDQVVHFLKTHPSINAVNFKLGAYKIWPDGYRRHVAGALVSGEIRMGTAVNKDAAASYGMDQDRLELAPTANLSSLRDQGLVVHECTHAIIDMCAIGEHSAFEDEAVAYIAQAIFLTRCLGDADSTPDIPVPLSDNDEKGIGIYREAKRIAAKAMRSRAYCIEKKEAANLIQMIGSQSIYRKYPRYPSNRFRRNFFYNFLHNR